MLELLVPQLEEAVGTWFYLVVKDVTVCDPVSRGFMIFSLYAVMLRGQITLDFNSVGIERWVLFVRALLEVF